MAAPMKPWERGGNVGSSTSTSTIPTLGDVPRMQVNQHSMSMMPGPSGGPTLSRTPPSLPTRPSQQGSSLFGSTVNRYGGFGNGLGSSYGSNYGLLGSGFGSYGGMCGSGGGMYGGGMYGGGMYGGGSYFGQGQLSSNGDPRGYNQFLRRAEENSRPAFQSIESIVQAFGSISMMMESTLQTVYNSFRAVIGVADHFSRLKVHLAHIFTALALFRTLRYIYRRVLVFLGLKTKEFAEEIWEKVHIGNQGLSEDLEKLAGKKKNQSPSWPIFMFFAVVIGGPYIIWKLLCSTEEEESGQLAWASGDEDHVVARAEFDFDAERNNELSFRAGAMMNLAPKESQPKVRGWILASVDGKTTGLVPANFIKILGRRRGQKATYMDPHGHGQPTKTNLQEEHGRVSSKLDSETPATDTASLGNKSQDTCTSLLPPTTNRESYIHEFNEAFIEAPRMCHQKEKLEKSTQDEWSTWKMEETQGDIGDRDKQLET